MFILPKYHNNMATLTVPIAVFGTEKSKVDITCSKNISFKDFIKAEIVNKLRGAYQC